jgi:hypothetical protein
MKVRTICHASMIAHFGGTGGGQFRNDRWRNKTAELNQQEVQ